MHFPCLPCAACLLCRPPEPLQADNPEICLKMKETPVCLSDKSSQTLSEITQSELEKQEATQHVCCPQYNTVHSDSDRHRSPAGQHAAFRLATQLWQKKGRTLKGKVHFFSCCFWKLQRIQSI